MSVFKELLVAELVIGQEKLLGLFEKKANEMFSQMTNRELAEKLGCTLRKASKLRKKNNMKPHAEMKSVETFRKIAIAVLDELYEEKKLIRL